MLPCLITIKKNIPFHHLMDDWSWIDKYLRGNELAETLKVLKRERMEVVRFPASISDFTNLCRDFWEQAYQAKIESWAKHLQEYREDGRNPFFPVNHCLEHMGAVGPLFLLPVDWQTLTEALKMLPEGITERERQKSLARLDEKIAKMQAELGEYQPPGRYLMNDAHVICDTYQTFVDFWVQKQSKVNGPIGVQGIDLLKSPDAEQKAWKRLGMGDYVSRKSMYTPNPG